MRAASVLAAFLGSASSASPALAEKPEAMMELPGAWPGEPDLSHDLVLPAPDSEEQLPDVRSSASPPLHLYLNFSDGTETLVQAPSDRARDNVSVIGGADPYPEFKWAAFTAEGTTREEVIRSVSVRIHRAFLPYNVLVSTARPSTGTYTMVMIGGGPGVFGFPNDVAGIAVMDCSNRQPGNIVFAFPANIRGSGHVLFVTIAQEAGHSYGLEHTTNQEDLMYPRALSSQRSFPDLDSPVSGRPLCLSPVQNSHTRLLGIVGEWTGGEKPFTQGTKEDRQPPTVRIVEPVEGADVGADFVVRASAEDDVGVERVVIDVGGERATLSRPPWEWYLTDFPAGVLPISVVAVDAVGHTSSASLEVTIAAAAEDGTGGCAAVRRPSGSGALLAAAAGIGAAVACARRRRRL